METSGVRINKFLSEAGVCSRREADRKIENGEVRINDSIASTGDRVMPEDVVYVNGRPVQKEEEMILLALNKPVGIVCTAEKREKNNVIDFMKYPKRIYPIGRLDKDSEGLLLMTNNGELVNKIMRAGNMHEKEYIVTVNKPVSDSFVRGLAGGVPLVELNTTTRKCKVEKISNRKVRIILTQGLNRQIRRMCEYFGYRVEKLERVRIMNIELGDLKSGQYREITGAEYAKLMQLTEDSSSEPIDYEKRAKESHTLKKEGKRTDGKKQHHKSTQEKEKNDIKKSHKIYVVQNRNLD
ncbi:MAG: 23S rRNA pseudouridine(2604) synthase RluF [Agathobacter sp.]|nr:23S rRNA pseudouridine(2604) synthase RluF [Agathobacter sp.]